MVRFKRSWIFLSIILLAVFTVADAQTPQRDTRPRTASISGRVTISGKAAANAKIVITEIKNGSGLDYHKFPIASKGLNAGESYVVLTDAEGRYRQTNLPEGDYETQAILRGFVKEKLSQREFLFESFSLNEGESRENVDFTLVRGGVITGRVTDTDGRPLIAKIISLQVVDAQGRKTDDPGFMEIVEQGRKADMFQTDDRGVYRIYGLRAGRYLVSAGGEGNSVINILTGDAGEYPRTWYPDATNENQAKTIEVTAGGEITGVDIRLGDAKRTYEAAGRVVNDETGKPIAGSGVICVKIKGSDGDAMAAGAAFGGFGGKTKTDEQGNFRLVGLAPGQYQLNLGDFESFLTGSSDHYSDGTRLEIQSSDVTGVEIRAKRGATIRGVAVVEEAGPSAKQALSQMRIREALPPPASNGLNENAIAASMSPAFSRIGSDGGFFLKGVRPGKVILEVEDHTQSGLKVLRIERGGTRLSDGIVVAGHEDITGVRVILGKGSGVIRGQVNVTGGALPKGFQLDLIAERIRDSISAQIHEYRRVDNKGQFVIEGLLPGEWVLKLILDPSPEADLNSLNVDWPKEIIQRVSLAKGQEAQVTMTLDLSKKDQE